jgi:hypothetical protein
MTMNFLENFIVTVVSVVGVHLRYLIFLISQVPAQILEGWHRRVDVFASRDVIMD